MNHISRQAQQTALIQDGRETTIMRISTHDITQKAAVATIPGAPHQQPNHPARQQQSSKMPNTSNTVTSLATIHH